MAMADLAGAEEIFITSSTRDVHPVDAVIDDDGQRVWAAGDATLTRLRPRCSRSRSAAQWNP